MLSKFTLSPLAIAGLFGLLTAPAAVVSVNTSQAYADTHAQCADYANRAVARHRQNRNAGCGFSGPRWQYNWNNHYTWCRGVSRAAHRSETRARRRLINNCTGGGAPQTRTFHQPRVGGVRLDWCRSWGQACGRPAATAYCRRRGYSRAISWRQAVDVGRWTSTRIISTGQLCSANFCDSFQWIRCQR